MKAITKNILLIVIVFLLVFNLRICFKEANKTSIKTTVSKRIEIRKDSVQHKAILNVKDSIVYDTVQKVIVQYVTRPSNKNEITKEVFKVKDTFNLSNAKVYSTIFSEGKVLKHDVKVITRDSIITKQIEKETIVYETRNALFLNVSPIIGFNTSLIGAEATIDYTIQHKFRIGAGVGFINTPGQNTTPYYKISIGIPLN